MSVQSQTSYTKSICLQKLSKKIREKNRAMVPTRVELATLALLAPRSNRLSYGTALDSNVAGKI